MKRTLAGLIALVFLSSAAWTFLNESVVEDWLVGQLVIDQNDPIEIIPLQTEERWFVVVVDFEANGIKTYIRNNFLINCVLVCLVKPIFLKAISGCVIQ